MTKEKRTGPISVTDDITPITHQPVENVNANQWSNISLSDLWDERIVLENRLNYALQIGHTEMIQQLQSGIIRLDAVIQHRTETSGEDRLL